MKIALCFFGQPRFLNNPYTYLSHKFWILDKYNTDIYIHTWIDGEEKECKYSDWVLYQQSLRNEKYETPKEYKGIENDIIKKYKPKKYIFENSKHFSLDEKSRNIIKEIEKDFISKYGNELKFNYSENNENNVLSQLYSMSKSISLIDSEYDWIILSRYDNYIWDFPNLYQLDKNNLYLNNTYLYNFQDVLMFGGQKHIEILNCFDSIPELCKKIDYFTPEEFKKCAYRNIYQPDPNDGYLYLYQIGKEKRISIGVGIVRTNTLENLQI